MPLHPSIDEEALWQQLFHLGATQPPACSVTVAALVEVYVKRQNGNRKAIPSRGALANRLYRMMEQWANQNPQVNRSEMFFDPISQRQTKHYYREVAPGVFRPPFPIEGEEPLVTPPDDEDYNVE